MLGQGARREGGVRGQAQPFAFAGSSGEMARDGASRQSLLREFDFEALQADPACRNAKQALSVRRGIPERSLMRATKAARQAREATAAAAQLAFAARVRGG